MSGEGDMETVLDLHQLQYGPNVGQFCSCGEVGAPDPDLLMSMQDWHRAHLAQALRDAGFGDVAAAKAEALREAAEAINTEPDSRSCTWGTDEAVRIVELLRARADIEADR